MIGFISNSSDPMATTRFDIIIVDINGTGDYTTIHEAIFNANNGDTINVKAGIYNENIQISKQISLIGEGANDTIIKGNEVGNVVIITGKYVTVTNFTITGSGSTEEEAGLKLDNAQYCKIESNNISFNKGSGIRVWKSNNCSILKNKVFSNQFQGIDIWYSGDLNIFENNASFNIF
jgi:parallel beta-helix repeat protein